MAFPPIRRTITTEDYEPEYAQMVTRLSYVLNPFINEVVDALEGQLDFENTTQNLLKLQLNIGANGQVLNGAQINAGIINPNGLQIILARNLTNPSSYPTATPFISFTPVGDGIISIDNITSLPVGTYQINIIVY